MSRSIPFSLVLVVILGLTACSSPPTPIPSDSSGVSTSADPTSQAPETTYTPFTPTPDIPTAYTLGRSYSFTIPQDVTEMTTDEIVTVDMPTWLMTLSTSTDSIEKNMDRLTGYEWQEATYGEAEGHLGITPPDEAQGRIQFFFNSLGAEGTPIGHIEVIKHKGEDTIGGLLEDPTLLAILESILAPE